MSETEFDGVPVTVNGIEAGEAKVSSTGDFVIRFTDDHAQARRIVQMLYRGEADGISIDANPTQPNGDVYRRTLD